MCVTVKDGDLRTRVTKISPGTMNNRVSPNKTIPFPCDNY